MKKKQHFVPITRRTLFQRVNRALAKKCRNLRTHRAGQSGTPGTLFVVDVKRNRVVSVNQDLEQLGDSLGVLEPWERVEKARAPLPEGRRTR